MSTKDVKIGQAFLINGYFLSQVNTKKRNDVVLYRRQHLTIPQRRQCRLRAAAGDNGSLLVLLLASSCPLVLSSS